MRKLRWVLGVLVVATVGFLVWERVTFDRAAWLADYDQLRRHMNRSYANLVDAIRTGGVDPVALHRRTRARLEDASTDRQARAAIADFVAAFDDGHLRVHRVKLSKRLAAWWRELWADDAARAGTTTFASAVAACDALGFENERRGLGFALSGLPGFAALDDASNSFSAGVATVGGRKLGFLRIPSFSQLRYRSACLRAWDRRPSLDRPCDEACQDQLYSLGVPEQLLADLAARLDQLAERKIDLLVVDLTGNGGGTEWVTPATRLFSSTPLACPRQAFIKHPHWTNRLEATLRDVEQDLGGTWSDAERAFLVQAQERLTRLLRRAGEPCDLASIWTTPGMPSCTHLVDDEYTSCGVFADLPAGVLVGARSRDDLHHLLRYTRPASRPPPRTVVLVDEKTASAAEELAVTLVDHQLAIAVGRRSAGAGCGYTRGGLPAILEHSGMRVDMPDCLRRRADGRNERFGVEPSIPVAWDGNDEARRDQLVEALRRLPPPR